MKIEQIDNNWLVRCDNHIEFSLVREGLNKLQSDIELGISEAKEKTKGFSRKYYVGDDGIPTIELVK
jgi:hypothetical protein